MQEAFRKVGVADRKIERGEIYMVPDKLIALPKSRLPNRPEREIHEEGRPVLILQTDLDNQDFAYPIVLIAPLSHRVELKDDKDYRLNKGQGGIWKDSLVQLGLIQPILKTELTKQLGKLDTLTMNDIDAVLAANIGLIERPNHST
jgi:mRNA-degrading endonuclease toxin of MazEF toxin-antitoxin module